MDTRKHRPPRLPATATVFFAWLAWSHFHGIQAQPVYTSTPGKTTVVGSFDPQNPQPKAPVIPLTNAAQPALPVVSAAQYQAHKGVISQYSQSSFSSAPTVEIAGPIPRAPNSPTPTVKSPIVSTPT